MKLAGGEGEAEETVKKNSGDGGLVPRGHPVLEATFTRQAG